MRKLSRRTFLQAASAATLATTFKAVPAQMSGAHPENGTLIPDEGWRLWIDKHAQWKDDAIFLPEDVNLAIVPTNPPTGGWSALTEHAGKQVILPTTVEQHFWGKFGQRPYTSDEYPYLDDPIPQNGAYLGVSWWYRNIDIPVSMKNKRIVLHIRGARLRAEVYLNEKLVGYSIMEELPFECDLTTTAHPGGQNTLAIRITNPFGRYDWVDDLNAQWGVVKLHCSHGFGGLDRGMTISAHDGVCIKDAWVLNTASPKTIKAMVVIESHEHAIFQRMNWELIDADTGKRLIRGTFPRDSRQFSITKNLNANTGGGPKKTTNIPVTTLASKELEITFPQAELWDVGSPRIYHLRITVQTSAGTDTRIVPFGFRWFAPSGLGINAIFRLNGRRIKLYSSISWGFWGLNGLFPTPELAEKEVSQARKLNLNCLNFHRNIGKEEVFRAHDRLGLLRYMEPGGGKLTIGARIDAKSGKATTDKPRSEANNFAQRFMIAKCIHMIRAFRSHPSLIQYTLQNEISTDLKKLDTLAILAAMRAEDPSRSIVLNDGFSPSPRSDAQAWYEPYNDKLHRSDEQKFGEWWNNHQGAGDQWYDEFYTDPRTFVYQSPHKKILTEFGEMEGCATPDNHSLMIHQITKTYAKYGGDSYDLTDHKEILAAYDKFLDKWTFRQAFPATEHLWLSIGSKCYDTWQNYLENARISDGLDFAVISGWESTAIENHSGIVDNLRNFKSDPTPISGALAPIRPVAKQRSACTSLGKPATFDLYLLNDTPNPATGILNFTAVTPSGNLLKLATFPSPPHVPEQFSYLIKEAFQTPRLTEQGLYQFKFSVSSAPLSIQSKEIWVTGLPAYKRARSITVAVADITPSLRKQLADLGPHLGITVEDFALGQKYDAIVSSGLTSNTSIEQHAGEITGFEPSRPAKSEPGEAAATTQAGRLAEGILDAVRAGSPLLAIPQADILSDGVAKQLAAAGAFAYRGNVGDLRAPWMGNWYFVRKHPIYEGLPVDRVMGIHYQVRGSQSNGLLVAGANVEIIAAYSRDHDRNIGAGTFTTKLGFTKVLYHRVPEFHPVLQQRFLVNALMWLTT